MTREEQAASYAARFPRVPRNIIREDDPDFIWWKALLKNNLGERLRDDAFSAFNVFLHVSPDALDDWWRYANYVSRNLGSQASTRNYPDGKYTMTKPEGFMRFLQKEPGKAFGRTLAAIAGFALLPPMGAFIASGAVKGAQTAEESGRTVLGNTWRGAVAGYGKGIQIAAPLLNLAAPGAGGAASKIGAGLTRVAAPKPIGEPQVQQMPEKYRRLQQALIEVESNGDPNAVSASGTYVGLLQMGPAAAKDVGIGANYKQVLLGDAAAAIDAFWAYQARYVNRTGAHPVLMAMLWKGGPGTVKKFTDLLAAGASPGQALATAEQLAPNLEEYMRRAARAYQQA